MPKVIAFVVLSGCLAFVSRRSLRLPHSHGFYRFFAWELIAGLLLLNVGAWFRDPFSWHQLASWFLLALCIIPLVLGLHSLRAQGRPAERREDGPELLALEKTTTLVNTGIYHYIRHPLYSSLLLLAWGIFLKVPTWVGALLALGATLLLVATAAADEAECIRTFGAAYERYIEETKRFVPFLF